MAGRGRLELAACLALSAALHLALLLRLPEGAAGASGARGADVASLTASSAAMSALVERWERPVEHAAEPPERAEPPVEPAAPAPPETATDARPEGTRPRLADPVEAAEAPDIQASAVALPVPVAPDTPVTASANPEPAAPSQERAPDRPQASAMSRPLPERQPQIDTRPADPPESVAVLTSTPPPPRPRREVPEVADAPSPAATAPAQPERQAAGAGTQGPAGTQAAATASLTEGQRADLIQQWASEINATLARRSLRTRGSGTVVIDVTLLRSGALDGARIQQSSGNPTVDQAALAMVQRGDFPAAPRRLEVARHRFRLPIDVR